MRTVIEMDRRDEAISDAHYADLERKGVCHVCGNDIDHCICLVCVVCGDKVMAGDAEARKWKISASPSYEGYVCPWCDKYVPVRGDACLICGVSVVFVIVASILLWVTSSQEVINDFLRMF